MRHPHGLRCAAEAMEKTAGIEVVNVVCRIRAEIGNQFRCADPVRNASVRDPDTAMIARR